VQDLALRLAALDPQASAAIGVIGYFDSLVASRAGLQSIVRGAAALAGCPARLNDVERRLTIRVLADGTASSWGSDPDAEWPSASVAANGSATLWLETTGPTSTVEAVVLERAAAAALAVLQRTRSSAVPEDPAALELILDPTANEADRLSAAKSLHIPDIARAVALADGTALVIAAGGHVPSDRRAGIGTSGGVRELPNSWLAARLALRLAAEGTTADPGPRVVYADQLGALALLVRLADDCLEPISDIVALDRAARAASSALETLDTFARAASLRDAARILHVHHSTLQDRLSQVEVHLGWTVRDPDGLLRLQLALALRRASRNPA
jgi:hypothetical protein